MKWLSGLWRFFQHELLVLASAAANRLPAGVRAESEARASRIGEKMPLILLAVSAALLLWLAIICWAAYSFIMWLAH